jgi:hypothetical protein
MKPSTGKKKEKKKKKRIIFQEMLGEKGITLFSKKKKNSFQ